MTRLVVFAAMVISLAVPAAADDRAVCGRTPVEAAIAACTRLIESGGLSKRDLSIAYNNRGNAWGRKRQYDRAIADLGAALRLNPRYAEAYYNRGLAWARKRQYNRAIADYSAAIGLNPRYAKAYDNRGAAFERLGRPTEAIRDYRAAARLLPNHRAPRAALKRLGAAP